jgi:hypothetical protein
MSAWKILTLVGAWTLALTATANAAQVEKIADGLDNPRHLAFSHGDLYVAEAGRGGPGPCFPGPPELQVRVCVGASGAVTVIDEDGNQSRLVEGLASLAGEGTGDFAAGPHGIFIKGEDKLFITNGGPADARDRDQAAAQNPVADLFGRVLMVDDDGNIRPLADIWDFERDNNPHPREIYSNPVDVLVHGNRLVVADAGANDLLKINKQGTVELLTVFGDRIVPSPFGNIPMESVPTAVVEGTDHDYFVSELTGFPFPVGGANVYRVDRKTGRTEVFASGFTNIMDLALDEHGTLWVLEIDHDSLFPPIGPSSDGAIFAVDEHGAKKQLPLAPGTLTEPGGITVGEGGDLYVTNRAATAGHGEVLQIRTELGDDADEDEE